MTPFAIYNSKQSLILLLLQTFPLNSNSFIFADPV
nr:MAG TPA: hypothetical protein [Caudoviricetes sp.]